MKYNWWEHADINLIGRSLDRLKYYSIKYPQVIFNVNYPGIGYGGIERKIMENILKLYKQHVNVIVWEI